MGLGSRRNRGKEIHFQKEEYIDTWASPGNKNNFFKWEIEALCQVANERLDLVAAAAASLGMMRDADIYHLQVPEPFLPCHLVIKN
jgi:hypothetical protein